MPNATQAIDECAETIAAAGSLETQTHPQAEDSMLFGRYRTVRELGRGGMGVVLLAHDTVLDLQVALKLIPETVVRDTEGIVDLKKEVLRGMELTHPGIVRVFSFEQDATTAAIVMEYVEGQSLAQRKAQRPSRCFDCEEILPWLEQLCATLDYAHAEARIAHRDLKPGNLMITTSGRLKVADFGIASSLSDTLSRVSVRSDNSGTPPYMSPQQAMGQRPSHLDDIYALGATVYELMTGKPPFFRGNILAQLMQEEPVSMTRRREEFGITEIAPIPPAWEKMVTACLAKEPGERPQSGAAILEILKNPERSLALRSRPTIAPSKLEIVPREPFQPMAASSTLVAQTAEVVSWNSKSRDVRIAQPSQVLALCSSLASGTVEIVAAILRPIFKVLLVLGAIWGLLHLKAKWDTLEAKRSADAAKLQAAQRAAEAEAAPRPQKPVLQPPPFQPPPGPPGGMGQGAPPAFAPPPPPPHR